MGQTKPTCSRHGHHLQSREPQPGRGTIDNWGRIDICHGGPSWARWDVLTTGWHTLARSSREKEIRRPQTSPDGLWEGGSQSPLVKKHGESQVKGQVLRPLAKQSSKVGQVVSFNAGHWLGPPFLLEKALAVMVYGPVSFHRLPEVLEQRGREQELTGRAWRSCGYSECLWHT